MPTTIHMSPAWPADVTTPADAARPDSGWEHLTGNSTITAAAVLAAAILGGLIVYLLTRRPRRADFSKHLMYAPLLLVNTVAIYGQVAFAYEKVAPSTWPGPGKVALGILFAAAIESIAVYVGWHAHDALLMKSTATARQLRKASYGIALVVGSINYWHFAGSGMASLEPTAASIAFGLLSLLSPWLWGLHTRRLQHVQLTKDGAVDATGVMFSSERIRLFPYRAFMARRWSVDNYVTDPETAWRGYNAELTARRASTRATRVRRAWLVLSGRADITPGIVPAVRVDSAVGAEADIRPVSITDTAQGVTNGRAPGIAAGGHPAPLNGSGPGARPGHSDRPKPARMPTQNRASNPGVGRTSQPTSAQLKAFKLREQNPGITWAQLAAKVGKNERTVRRWFEAQRPSAEPEERAPMPTPAPTFDPPRVPVLAGVNGNQLHP